MRARLSGLIALAAATALVATGTTSRPPDDVLTRPVAATYSDAITYRMNAGRTAASTGTPLRAGLTRSWKRELGKRVSYPLIVNGRVYVTVLAESGAWLYALRLSDGRTLWRSGLVRPPLSMNKATLTYDRGRLMTLADTGQAAAFDAATGRRLWARNLRTDRYYIFTSEPAARSGVLYVNGDGAGSQLRALDTASGRTLWARRTEGTAAPAVDSTSVYGLSGGGYAYRLNLDGSTRWSQDPTGSRGGEIDVPVLSGDRMLAPEPGATRVLDRSTGKIVAEGNLDTGGTPVAIGSGIAVMAKWLASGPESSPGVATVTAVDLATLRPLWSNTGDGLLATPPVISGQRVYFASVSGDALGYTCAPVGRSGSSHSAWAPLGP